jgi:hypothetical protein
MLEEIIAGFLSLFSAFTFDPPHFSRQKVNLTGVGVEKLDESSLGEDETPTLATDYGTFKDTTISSSWSEYVHDINEGEIQMKPTFLQSITRSLKANLSITLAVFLLAAIGISFIYFDLRTCDLCFEWRSGNNTTPFSIMRIKLIGDCIEGFFLNLWFPASLIILFGWSEFKQHFFSTVYVGIVVGLMATLYLTFLLLFDLYDTNVVYRIPGNMLFATGLIIGSLIVVRKIREIHPNVSYSDVQIMAVVSVEFLASFAIAMYYRYLAVPWFNALENEMYKFIVATLTPVLTVFPIALCKHMALRRSSEIIDPKRSFILVYFMRGASIALYRVMQADFKNLWMFIGLSLFSGFTYMFKTATFNLRNKMWAGVIKFLNKTCCSTLRQLPCNTSHSRRLKADTEIQNILFENNTLIISQAYLVLYMVISFELSDWSVIKQSLIRLAIGFAIEFFFNTFSIFFHTHWYNVPIPRVWSQCWRRHVFANAVILVVIVCYFTAVLLSVFQVRIQHSKSSEIYVVRNCTLPFANWR